MDRFRSLLMPVGLGGDVEQRITGGLAVTKHFGAHLQLLFTYVSPRQSIPEDIFGMSKEAMRGLTETADRHAEEVGADLHAMFDELCRKQGVALGDRPAPHGPSATWRQRTGLRSQLIAHHGRVADLVLLSRPTQARPSASFEAALLETGKPLLLMPRDQQSFRADHILVGWNGSREAARAVNDALPLLTDAKAVVVVTTADRATVDPTLDAIGDYLSFKGVSVTTDILRPQTHHIGNALVDAAKAHSADLIVMGGYSRPRMREIVFGGVTLEILDAADCPVLMAH